MNWDWDKLQEKRQRRPQASGSWDNGQHNASGERFGPGRRGERGQGRDEGDNGNGRRGGGGGGGSWPEKLLGQGMPTGRGLGLIVIGLALLWALSGIYIINPDEQGVVLRFGRYVRTVDAGPHYHLPYPIEEVYKPKVTQVLRSEVGFRSVGQGATFQQGQVRTIPEEASMLTGDENIVNVQFSVQYKIKDPVQYLFNVTDQAKVVRNAAEATMREVIGKSMIDAAITDGKLKIQSDATELLQNILNRYEVGVQIIAVQLQDVHPPQGVIDAFKDVASAREDKSRIINEAEAYSNEVLPKARGQAAEMENQARAYQATREQQAEGEAKRFLTVLSEYEKARDVTRKRLYYEAAEQILSHARDKIILPQGAAGQILPFLPLNNHASTGASGIGDGARSPRSDAALSGKGDAR